MKQETDLRTYFARHAPRSRAKAEAWKRAADTILRNGVRTMREFGKKDDEGLFSLFASSRDDQKGLDWDALHLAREIHREYLDARRKADLLAAGEVLIESWFYDHGSRDAPKGIVSRAVNALHRARYETMSDLRGAKPEELLKIRNLGGKSLALTLLMREKYISQNGGTENE